jgi:uncharacterized membrane protein
MVIGLVLAIHILAVIIWLGGLFFLVVVLGPSAESLDAAGASSVWYRTLSRSLAWGWLSLVLIVVTGVAMVFLVFGGYGHLPNIHRVNMAIGIPAIALYSYVYLMPWRQLGRAVRSSDRVVAAKKRHQVRTLLATILVLALSAAFMSALGRYYSF